MFPLCTGKNRIWESVVVCKPLACLKVSGGWGRGRGLVGRVGQVGLPLHRFIGHFTTRRLKMMWRLLQTRGPSSSYREALLLLPWPGRMRIYVDLAGQHTALLLKV